ncbi:MAG: hypothetical protein IKC27_03420 [Kiritimatiellae bacterium]|nr:hypothetical protein [Kiritimatiellia bacterium]
MKMIFALFLAIILTGCATVETSDVGGRHMVVVSNSGWYLFNLIPIASGNPEKVNKVSCSLFSETATLENNYKMLDDIIKSSGAKSVKSLKSFWNDESILVILMKRHVIHTTAELVFDEDGEKK